SCSGQSVEEGPSEAFVAQEVIVEEIEVPTRQAIDLAQRIVHGLGVEPPTAGEEGVAITEVAGVRAPAGDHDRVRHEIPLASNQISANGRRALERALCRVVSRRGI